MDFYYCLMSAPCRGPMLTAKALGIDLNMKTVNIMGGDQMKPEFVAINPQHCVPTLVDGDLKLWESRAISAYLVNQYGKDDSLYPKDPKKRALVDKMLYFDIGTLYSRFGQWVYPVLFGGASPDPEKLEKLYEALGWLDSYLLDTFIAGPKPTIADHALVASVSTFAAGGVDIARFPKISAWLSACKSSMAGYDENEKGAQQFGGFAKPKLGA